MWFEKSVPLIFIITLTPLVIQGLKLDPPLIITIESGNDSELVCPCDVCACVLLLNVQLAIFEIF